MLFDDKCESVREMNVCVERAGAKARRAHIYASNLSQTGNVFWYNTRPQETLPILCMKSYLGGQRE